MDTSIIREDPTTGGFCTMCCWQSLALNKVGLRGERTIPLPYFISNVVSKHGFLTVNIIGGASYGI